LRPRVLEFPKLAFSLALEMETKKRLDALVTKYLLQAMSEDEARDLALKDVLKWP
jgi:hypothetical protein